MSGIVGIVNPRGMAVDRRLLQRMTESLACRGPDAQEVWASGSVGFGHTMLRTTPEAAWERQPCSLDSQVWITADARVDGRAELIAKLASRGAHATLDTPDAALILHAYHTWGEACLDHLIGDFAFAIWDGRAQRLFCARDHFGVKPFYYAFQDGSLIFSNTLDAVRLHPAVSDRLNDAAIADFLLLGYKQDPPATTFADIHRLPPAHALTWSLGTLTVRRYWSMPVVREIRYRRAGDYVEQFRALLRVAVADRLRTTRVGVLMSGGLDSPAVAAIARDLLAEQGAAFDLRAHTVVYDRVIPDEERHYAGLVARSLGIPIHCLPRDDYVPFGGGDAPRRRPAQPVENCLLECEQDLLAQVAAYSRVGLTGHATDVFLHPSSIAQLVRAGRVRHLPADLIQCACLRLRPPLGLGVLALLNRWRGRGERPRELPAWLVGRFADRTDERGRLRRPRPEPEVWEPARAGAYRKLTRARLGDLCEYYEQAAPSAPVELRHPFFDLRLVSYMLALPSIPWCVDKQLLRAAMRGVLPEAVRLRPKTPLYSMYERLYEPASEQMRGFAATPVLSRYVDRELFSSPPRAAEREEFWMGLRALSLNYWLQHLEPVIDHAGGGASHV